jgi:hypothetical protein
MKPVVIVLVAVLVLAAVGGGAFYAGTKIGANRVLSNPAQFLRQGLGTRGQGGNFQVPSGTPQAGDARRGGAFGGDVVGTVEKIEGTKVLVTTQDGTVTVQTTDTTLIQKYSSVGLDALKVDEQIVVAGTKNDDGSYTARSIRSMQGMQFQATDQQ